jgi:hypothetical protein
MNYTWIGIVHSSDLSILSVNHTQAVIKKMGALRIEIKYDNLLPE